MKRLFGLIAAGLLMLAGPALADPPDYAKTVVSCGTPGNTPQVGSPQPITIDTTGVLCTTAGGGGGGNTTVKATAAAPTYVEGSTTNPLSTNLSGELRTLIEQGGNAATVTGANALKVDGSAVTQPVSGTVTANAGSGTFAVNNSQVGGTTILTGNGTAGAGAQRVTIASDNTAFTVNATATGNAASGATDSGNPVKIGGVFNTTAPTVTTGQRVDIQMTNRGEQLVALSTGGSPLSLQVINGGDGNSNSGNGLVVMSRTGLFNGTSWDRSRSVVAGTNTTGTGIMAVGGLGQLDDTSTTACTEDQFCNLRITSARELKTNDASMNTVTGTQADTAYAGSGNATVVSALKAIANVALSNNPSTTQPNTATSTNGSSTVTTGSTFQSALASNSSRKGCLIQNPTTATEVLYVFFGANGSATTANSFSLAAGAAISCNNGGYVLTDNVSVTGATTGHAFVVNSQ